MISFRETIRIIRSDKILRWSWLLALAIEVIWGLVLVFYFKRLPPLVPLLYSLPWGNGQLVPWWILAVAFLLGFVALVINSTLSALVFSKEVVLGRIVMAGASLTIVLIATTMVRTILLTHF